MDLNDGYMGQRRTVGNMLNYLLKLSEALEESNKKLSEEILKEHEIFYRQCQKY